MMSVVGARGVQTLLSNNCGCEFFLSGFNSSGYILMSGIARSYDNSKLNFLDELSNGLTWQWHHLTFLPAVHKGSDFSTSSPTLVLVF